MVICAGIFTLAALGACGGGGGGAADSSTAAALGSGTLAATSVVVAPASSSTALVSVDPRSAADQFVESTLTLQAASAFVATTLVADIAAPATTVDTSATDGQAQALGASAPQYATIAVENATFYFDQTPHTVRYGAGSSWRVKTVSGAGVCSSLFFGGDPLFGTIKHCEVQVASTGVAAIDIPKLFGGSTGVSTVNVMATAEQAPLSDIGQFRTSCVYSHMAYDDPIVYPGQPGKSHLHVFFGNTGTNANSTATSIATSGNSTCRGGIANRTAYWVPALMDAKSGLPIAPDSAGIYYKTGYNGIAPNAVRPFPAGLRMIAGDARNATPGGTYRYKCIGGPNNSNDQYGPSIPNCDVGATIWQEIFFPQCWDGVNLDAPDHKSHMAYPSGGSCPATHPVALPEINFNIIYTVTEKDAPKRWRLASDTYDTNLPAGYSTHGDWFNGWDQTIMQAWVNNCDRASKDCHSHLLGDGRMTY